MSSFFTDIWGERWGVVVVGLRNSDSWADMDGASLPKVVRYMSEMTPERIESGVEGGDDNDGAAAAAVGAVGAAGAGAAAVGDDEDGIMVFFFLNESLLAGVV
jgi:uncharacterized protein (UPF0264 family)